MLNLKISDKDLFTKNGYIIKELFSKNEKFKEVSLEFKSKIKEEFLNKNCSNLGGFKSGNLNIHPGEFGKNILLLLNQLNFKEYFNFLTNDDIEKYNIIFGGNLNLRNSKNQFFHTDGNWNPRMIVVNIATSDVDLNNGPLEIIEGTHLLNIEYWKFALKGLFLKKTKLELKFGQILIREHRLWHRGTKNKTKNFREMMGIVFLKKQDQIQTSNESSKLYLHSNIFGNSKKEKFKEFIFLNFKFILFFYKILISILKKKKV
jgi:hypothetical protein